MLLARRRRRPAAARGHARGVRTLGLSGVANRFVDLRPGPDTRAGDPRRRRPARRPARGASSTSTRCSTASTRTCARDVRSIVRDAASALDDAQRASRPTPAWSTSTRPSSSSPRSGASSPATRRRWRSCCEHSAVGRPACSRATATRSAAGSTPPPPSSGRRRPSARRSRGALDARAGGAARDDARRCAASARGRCPSLDPVLRDLRPAVAPLAELLRADPADARERPAAAAPACERLVPQARAALDPLPGAARRRRCRRWRRSRRRCATRCPSSAACGLHARPRRGLLPRLRRLDGAHLRRQRPLRARSCSTPARRARPGLTPRPPSGSLGGLPHGPRRALPRRRRGARARRLEPVARGRRDACDPKDNQ